MSISIEVVPDFPRIVPGDHLGEIILDKTADIRSGDIICICSKIVSKAEDRYVDLSTVSAGSDASKLAKEVDKDPRLVELILAESESISRKRIGVLVTRHKLGIVSANAAIDASNAVPTNVPSGSGPWVLLLPENPDESARQIHSYLNRALGLDIGVIITDSLGRPFRSGTVGAAIGVAGIPALWDQRGLPDADDREMEFTITAFADQVAAASDLAAGQGAEQTPVVIVRGLAWLPIDPDRENTARDLIRDPEMDLYA